MPMDGKWTKEVHRWTTVAQDFAGKISRGLFNREAGNLVYPTLWVPKIGYVMGIVDFTNSQMKKIQSPVLCASLSSPGYNMHMPRAIVHGPTLLDGMNWDSL